jgi:hypothetical protein
MGERLYYYRTLTLNIILFLANHQTKDLLHFITCGNVDDGKSPLIVHILYDSHHVLRDLMSVLQKDSKVYDTTGGDLGLALLIVDWRRKRARNYHRYGLSLFSQ